MTIDIANPGANEAALEAALVQRLPPARLPMRSGRSYGVMNVTLVGHAVDFGAGYIFAIPILIPNAITIASLSIEVTTPADATTQFARLGIAADNNGIPSQTLLAEGDSELDLTQVGTLTTTLTGAIAAAGWHWLMIFIGETAGAGSLVPAELHCIDSTKPYETAFHIGAADPYTALRDVYLGHSPSMATNAAGTYGDYASLQAALTALGPVDYAMDPGTFIPAIALTVA